MKFPVLPVCMVLAVVLSVSDVYAGRKIEKSPTLGAAAAYASLLQRQIDLMSRMELMKSQIETASPSKRNRMNRKLNLLFAQYTALENQKALFPMSVVNPSADGGKEVTDRAREEVRREIERKVLERGGTTDDVPDYADEEQSGRWSVVISISTDPSTRQYEAYGPVSVERMGDRYVFFVGTYGTRQEAQESCSRIVKKGKFRDAFVTRR